MFRYSFPSTNSQRKLITELPILLTIFLRQLINTSGLSDCLGNSSVSLLFYLKLTFSLYSWDECIANISHPRLAPLVMHLIPLKMRPGALEQQKQFIPPTTSTSFALCRTHYYNTTMFATPWRTLTTLISTCIRSAFVISCSRAPASYPSDKSFATLSCAYDVEGMFWNERVSTLHFMLKGYFSYCLIA